MNDYLIKSNLEIVDGKLNSTYDNLYVDPPLPQSSTDAHFRALSYAGSYHEHKNFVKPFFTEERKLNYSNFSLNPSDKKQSCFVQLNYNDKNVLFKRFPQNKSQSGFNTNCKLQFETIEGKDINEKFDFLVNKINNLLRDFSDYDFSGFDYTNSRWIGKYIHGSSCCVFHINIYHLTEKSKEFFIVEVIRVEGDNTPKTLFNRQFSALMTGKPFKSNWNMLNFAPLPCSKLSFEDYMHGIEHIFTMIKSGFMDSKLEAAKMLFELGKQNDEGHLSNPECRSKCINALCALFSDWEQVENIHQFAILACARLCDFDGYKDDVIHSPLLSVIFGFVDNADEFSGAYETAQIRRVCATLLVSLLKHDSESVKQNLPELTYSDWQDKVGGISDLRTKFYAAEALTLCK